MLCLLKTLTITPNRLRWRVKDLDQNSSEITAQRLLHLISSLWFLNIKIQERSCVGCFRWLYFAIHLLMVSLYYMPIDFLHAIFYIEASMLRQLVNTTTN